MRQPNVGVMLLEGEETVLRSPVDSRRPGVAAIYQRVTSFPDLNVTENIFMGEES